jgi:hypothetical protein
MHKANIVIKHPNNSLVYLYTVNKGTTLPKILQKGLIRGRERWGDTASLTRIIFSEMIQNDVLGKTGAAISPLLMDNEQFLLVVDDQKERVGVFGESGNMYRKIGFAEYCAMREADLEWNCLVPHLYNEDNGLNRHKGDLYPFI